jgi:hypothetical protein
MKFPPTIQHIQDGNVVWTALKNPNGISGSNPSDDQKGRLAFDAFESLDVTTAVGFFNEFDLKSSPELCVQLEPSPKKALGKKCNSDSAKYICMCDDSTVGGKKHHQ